MIVSAGQFQREPRYPMPQKLPVRMPSFLNPLGIVRDFRFSQLLNTAQFMFVREEGSLISVIPVDANAPHSRLVTVSGIVTVLSAE